MIIRTQENNERGGGNKNPVQENLCFKTEKIPQQIKLFFSLRKIATVIAEDHAALYS